MLQRREHLFVVMYSILDGRFHLQFARKSTFLKPEITSYAWYLLPGTSVCFSPFPFVCLRSVIFFILHLQFCALIYLFLRPVYLSAPLKTNQIPVNLWFRASSPYFTSMQETYKQYGQSTTLNEPGLTETGPLNYQYKRGRGDCLMPQLMAMMGISLEINLVCLV